MRVPVQFCLPILLSVFHSLTFPSIHLSTYTQNRSSDTILTTAIYKGRRNNLLKAAYCLSMGRWSIQSLGQCSDSRCKDKHLTGQGRALLPSLWSVSRYPNVSVTNRTATLPFPQDNTLLQALGSEHAETLRSEGPSIAPCASHEADKGK